MQARLNGQSDATPITAIRWDSSWPESASPNDRLELLAYLENRFGLRPWLFEDYLFFKKQKSWWIFHKTPLLGDVSRFRISRMGMKAFQKVGQLLKPTTRMIQLFGAHATKATIRISKDNLLELQKGNHIDFPLGIGHGYVILCVNGNRVLGLGLYVNGRISTQISRKALKTEMIGE